MTDNAPHDGFFRALLRLFPSEFRGDFGRQMADDFRDQRGDAVQSGGRKGLVQLWGRTALDLLRRAPQEHFDIFRRDATHAIRVLRKRPASTATVVLSLAIGIGLNTALFSVVSGVLWRSLPFPDAASLVRVFEIDARSRASFVSNGDLVDLRGRASAFSSIGAGGYATEIVVEPGDPESLAGMSVTPGFFETLGIRPVLGRTFTPDEYNTPAPSQNVSDVADRLNGRAAGAVLPSRPIVISQSLWQRRFLGRTDVIGQKLRLASGVVAEVVGVMGPELQNIRRSTLDSPPEWWMARQPNLTRGAQIFDVVGRLAPGRTVASAQAELNVIGSNMAASHPESNTGRSLRAVPLLDTIVKDVRAELTFLFGAVLCVLLVTCVNVVHLFLANAAGRRTELATRVALGATRAHLVRQTLTESALLTAIGGAFGLLLAAWTMPLLISMAPEGIPRLHDVRADWSTLAFTAAVSLGVAMLCGVAASVPLTMMKPWSALGTARTGATLDGRRVRRALAVGEVAVALMLVVATMLMVRTMRSFASLDLGFNPHGVVTGVLPRPVTPAVDPDGLVRMHETEVQVVDAVRQLPGVVAVGVGGSPMGLAVGVGGVTVPGDPRSFGMAMLAVVSTGYFEALGAHLKEGRFFTVDDHAGAPTVAILGESTARRFWPDGSALGKTLNLPANPSVRVVGVVADMAEFGLVTKTGGIYLPHVQSSYVTTGQMIIRTSGDPQSLVPAIKAIIRRVNPETPFPGVTTLQDEIDRTTAPSRFIFQLIGLFSVLGLALATIGIYGVIAESVAERVREIGIRIALGAQRSDVVLMIVAQGAWMATTGIGLGLIGALLFKGQMAAMVFGVSTIDPLSYVAACGALIATALTACAIPARRAARLDPVVALRVE